MNNDQAVTIPVNGFQSPYSFMLSGLEANTTYDLSMSAVTDSIKEGPKSNAIAVTTLASGLLCEPRVLQVLLYTVLYRLHYNEYCSSV